MKWWDSRELSSPFFGTVLPKTEWASRCKSGVELLLTTFVRLSFPEMAARNTIFIAKFWCKLRSIIIVRCYAPTETSNIQRKEEDACYEQLYVVQEGLPEDHTRVVIDGLNDKEGFGNPLFEHVVRKHGFLNHSEIGASFENLCIFHRLVIGGTLLKRRACHKLCWTLTHQQRASDQIEQ